MFKSSQISEQTGLTRILIYHLPLLAYAALIYYVSSLPNINPPSFGVSWDDKIYHFGEYAVFSAFVFVALKYYNKAFIQKHIHLISAIITCLFALSDEIHQYYVPGREATMGDLCADCLGGILIQILLLIVLKFLRQKPID